jgi:hypothetical protein
MMRDINWLISACKKKEMKGKRGEKDRTPQPEKENAEQERRSAGRAVVECTRSRLKGVAAEKRHPYTLANGQRQSAAMTTDGRGEATRITILPRHAEPNAANRSPLRSATGTGEAQ